MTTATLGTPHPTGIGQPARRGELALALQEAFTVAVRLRAGRQVAADAASFRIHVKHVLSVADQAARAAGYDPETVKLAVYAYIALLDESVLNSAQPMFSDWARQPLQEEVFGEHMAGENFFRTLHDLLARQDSESLADLLEVYQLCLLLGFHGRYGNGDASVLGISNAVRAKIQRIRGGSTELAPDWRLPADEAVRAPRDRAARKLALFAGVLFAVTLGLFLFYTMLLRSSITELRAFI